MPCDSRYTPTGEEDGSRKQAAWMMRAIRTIMRKHTTLKPIGIMLVMLITARLWAGDPRTGTWKLVSAESSLDPPRVLSISHAGKGVHVKISGVHIEFTSGWDGHDNHVQNIPAFNQVVMRRIGKDRAEIKEKKNGALVATLNQRVSADRKELTTTTVQPGRADQITVWERSGGAHDSGNPFIGDWTQDFSKTRLRQGLVIKIEPSGNNGVHFGGEFSYTANFDGRDYPLKDSRNDTVALTQTDAHTVSSTYKRGDEIAEQDRWVVSPDGQQMTMTTTGTLGTGERLKESLIFRKQ
jgi:hypothetical protein